MSQSSVFFVRYVQILLLTYLLTNLNCTKILYFAMLKNPLKKSSIRIGVPLTSKV